MEKAIQKIMAREMPAILRIQTTAMKVLRDYLYGSDVLELMPVMLSTVTDPLCHSVCDAEISYMGQQLQLTKSMILHK